MSSNAAPAEQSTADEILDVAQELIQTVGFDGFSYRDIADRVGIKSASIHYHFPAKADLALAAARRYRLDFNTTVHALDEESDPLEQLTGFAEIFQNTLESRNRVCLCGMLASEAASVPEPVTVETTAFFDDQQTWISKTIEAGIESGMISPGIHPDAFARIFLSALEGAISWPTPFSGQNTSARSHPS